MFCRPVGPHDFHGVLHHPFNCPECARISAKKTAAVFLATLGTMLSFALLPTPLNIIFSAVIIISTMSYVFNDYNVIDVIYHPEPVFIPAPLPRRWWFMPNLWGTRIPVGTDQPSPAARRSWWPARREMEAPLPPASSRGFFSPVRGGSRIPAGTGARSPQQEQRAPRAVAPSAPAANLFGGIANIFSPSSAGSLRTPGAGEAIRSIGRDAASALPRAATRIPAGTGSRSPQQEQRAPRAAAANLFAGVADIFSPSSIGPSRTPGAGEAIRSIGRDAASALPRAGARIAAGRR